jgi:2'-5' RNA ligase
MKRTFIAVKIEAGEKLQELISTLRSELKNDSIKWVDTDNLHITVAFLGNTAEETIKKVTSVLTKSCIGFGDFTFTISGLGIFKNLNDPRVIWAGIERSDKFANLNDIIKSGLNDSGIEIEDRQFRPHLTLGRIRLLKNRYPLEDLIGKYSKSIFQNVNVTEIVFYESVLQQDRPVYKPMNKFGLLL